MGEGRTEPPIRRLTVDAAADALGVTTEAVRGRIRRDTIKHERVGGRVYVLLPAEQSSDQIPDHTAELIRTLQEQLQAERQAHAEARRIIAGLVERIPPQLEAATEPRESPGSPGPRDTATEAAREAQEPRESSGMHMPEAGGGPLPHDQQRASERPWWRRMFGGER